jgi:hypothetical protein
VTFWNIIITTPYFEQFSKIPLGEQFKIHEQWLKVANTADPLSQCMTTYCPDGHNYILVNFFDIQFEFIIEIEKDNKLIRLISCDKSSHFDYEQHG